MRKYKDYWQTLPTNLAHILPDAVVGASVAPVGATEGTTVACVGAKVVGERVVGALVGTNPLSCRVVTRLDTTELRSFKRVSTNSNRFSVFLSSLPTVTPSLSVNSIICAADIFTLAVSACSMNVRASQLRREGVNFILGATS